MEKGVIQHPNHEYWSMDNTDNVRLTEEDLQEAVQEWADSIFPDPVPKKTTAYRWQPKPLPDSECLADSIVTYAIERLDEDYADPEDWNDNTTEGMRTAAIEFCKVVLSEYSSWAYQVVEEREINPSEYLDDDYFKAIAAQSNTP